MILNALAVILTCVIYGIEKKEIKSSLKKFKGAKRRFKEEIIGNRIIIDDYAHHPTEISATLEAVKQKYSDKEIVAIFLPNTYSRTEAFKEEFINSLNKANKVYVMPIYSDRESQKDFPNVSSDLIINEIDGAEEITLASVEKLLKHDDVVYCFMSCTNIYLIVDKFKETLKKML